MPDDYDPRYLRGIAYFNDADFFEAHEVWEGLWMQCDDGSRKFYQGLIQVAVCLHHFGNRNTRGASKLFHSSSNYLSVYRPWHLGIDLDRLLSRFATLLRGLVGQRRTDAHDAFRSLPAATHSFRRDL